MQNSTHPELLTRVAHLSWLDEKLPPSLTSREGPSLAPKHYFTVDVEDYFQVSAFDRLISRDQWADQESRVVGNTNRMLDLLEKSKVRGIFYVLGWVARLCPDLISRIHEQGHVLGSHTFAHRLIYEQTPMAFEMDLALSCEVIREITGQPVRHFRAPSFSITKKTLWAIPVLARQGIEFDSSVVPILHDRYGILDTPIDAYRLQFQQSSVNEFPVSVLPFGRLRIPVGGGGYFRIFPWWFTRWALKRIESTGRSIHFYVHPWEIDPEQPKVRGVGPITRFRHYHNLNKTMDRLERLLHSFPFGNVSHPIGQSVIDLTGRAETA